MVGTFPVMWSYLVLLGCGVFHFHGMSLLGTFFGIVSIGRYTVPARFIASEVDILFFWYRVVLLSLSVGFFSWSNLHEQFLQFHCVNQLSELSVSRSCLSGWCIDMFWSSSLLIFSITVVLAPTPVPPGPCNCTDLEEASVFWVGWKKIKRKRGDTALTRAQRFPDVPCGHEQSGWYC